MTTKSATLIDTAIQIGLIALLALWCFQIAAPFIGPIVWAGIIAIGIYPLYEGIKNKTGMSAGWTSTLLTLAMLVILLTPTMILSGALIENTQTLSTQLENNELKIPPPVEGVGDWPIIGEKLETFWSQASQDPKAAFGRFEPQLKSASKWLLSAAAGAGLGILVFVFSIIIAGVFLVSAKGARAAVVSIFIRLSGERGQELTEL